MSCVGYDRHLSVCVNVGDWVSKMSKGQVAAVWRKSGRNQIKCELQSDANKQTKINKRVSHHAELRKGQTELWSVAAHVAMCKNVLAANDGTSAY